jgi:hypothetical protein
MWIDALDLNAGRAGMGDRVVLRLACAASAGSERRPRGQPEGSEVMAEAEAKLVERAGGTAASRRSRLPETGGLPVDERPFEEHR